MADEKQFSLDDFNFDDFADMSTEKDTLEEGKTLLSKPQKTLIYTLFGETGYDKNDFKIEKISKLTSQEAKDLIEELISIKEDMELDEDEEDYSDYGLDDIDGYED